MQNPSRVDLLRRLKPPKPAAGAQAPAAPAPSSSAIETLASMAVTSIFEGTRSVAQQLEHTATALAAQGSDNGTLQAMQEITNVLRAMTARLDSMSAAMQALADRPVEVTLEMPEQGNRTFHVERDDDGRVTGIMES